MARTLHDRLRAREFDVGAKAFSRWKIRAADQEETELRLAQLFVEFRVAATCYIDGGL